MTIMDDENEFDYCYECGGYGDDYTYDPEEDALRWNCPDCPMNPERYDEEGRVVE